MDLHLDTTETEELVALLDASLGDLSTEIAGTDNAGYRKQLMGRRDVLRHLRERIGVTA